MMFCFSMREKAQANNNEILLYDPNALRDENCVDNNIHCRPTDRLLQDNSYVLYSTTVTVCTILGIVGTHSRYSLIFSIFYCISSLILFYFKQICSILSWKCLPITITSSTRTVSRLIY
jgi:hypothetical protein